MAKDRKTRGIYEKEIGSNVWWIRYVDSQGRLRREKAGRFSDAQTLLAKRRTETLQRKKLPENFRAKDVTFKTLCDAALEHSRASNTAKSTHELQLKVNELLPVFGNRVAASITKDEIVRWLTDEAKAREWKNSSRNRWQAAFSLIFRVGMDNEKIDRNPAARIRRKDEGDGRVRFLSDKEHERLRAAIAECGPRYIAAFDLSVNTGMRRSEQYTMRWSQVDFKRKLVTLHRTKNGKPRHIPLNDAAISALETLKADAGVSLKALPVFPSNRKDDAAQGPRGWFDAAVSRAKVKAFSWHCLRHTFASKLVMAGVDLRTVADLLGHRQLQMVMRYSHLAPEHTANAVSRVAFTSGQLTPQLTP